MEVFIRDEDKKWDISYSLADKNNSLDCKDHKAIIVKSLDQHDAEVRNKVIDELLEWADSKMMDWINSPKYREPHFRGTRIIHYYDLKQKLAELEGEKDE